MVSRALLVAPSSWPNLLGTVPLLTLLRFLGLNEYGTRFACHASHFLDKGFRVILPDLPSFGRSTGVHSNLTHPHLLTAAVHATLQDVVKQDLANGKKRKEVFMSGASMGGWTTLYYLITYPPTTKPEKIETSVQAEEGKVARANENQHGKKEEKLDPQNEYRPKIAGAFALCPLVEGESYKYELESIGSNRTLTRVRCSSSSSLWHPFSRCQFKTPCFGRSCCPRYRQVCP